jgi:hypothetical protein
MKHAELIRAALDGAVIQRVYNNGDVSTFLTTEYAISSMANHPKDEYRIKPADTVWYRAIYNNDMTPAVMRPSLLAMAAWSDYPGFIGIERITINDGKLVSVEIVPESEWRKPAADGGKENSNGK